MSVRKGSIGGGIVPKGDASNMRASPVANDSEYVAAVAVLNEDTMSAACALLLSEKDNDTGDESDYDKLLELFSKCQQACKVIERRAPVPMPFLQIEKQRGPTAAARAQAVPLKPKAKTMIPPRRSSVVSRSSAKKTGHVPAPHSFVPPPARKLQRETSDSSFASSSSVGSGRSSKKARLSPPTLDNQAGGGSAKAPPPEARSFLAALNAQGKRERHDEKRKPVLKKKEPSPKARDALPPTPGSRKQPSRSSRKG